MACVRGVKTPSGLSRGGAHRLRLSGPGVLVSDVEIWAWLVGGQFNRLEELIVCVVMMVIGLFAEDWIDGYREGRRK